MKDENSFNRWFSQQLNKIPYIFANKFSDKYKRGVPDFIIMGNGTCIAIETKFCPALPERSTTSLLSHGFSPEQVNFGRSMISTGNNMYGLIYCDQEKSMYLIPWEGIQKYRKPSRAELFSITGIREFKKNPSGVELLIQYILRMGHD